MAVAFHRWFERVHKEVGTSPFRAAVQNFLYTQDPDSPGNVRIQSFINGLLVLVEQLKGMPDPEPAPVLPKMELNPRIQQEYDASVFVPAAFTTVQLGEQEVIKQLDN